MVITVVQTRNRFFRFSDDKTSVPHYEIRDTSKIQPYELGIFHGICKDRFAHIILV